MGLGGTAARPVASVYQMYNSPPINGQCTNHRIAVCKGVFIATQLNSTQLNSTELNWPSWTAYSQVSRVFVYDVTTYKLSLWVNCCLRCRVEFSWVQLCRYKRDLMIRCCAVLMWPLKGERHSIGCSRRWRPFHADWVAHFLAESYCITLLRCVRLLSSQFRLSSVCLSVSLMYPLLTGLNFSAVFLERVVAQPFGSVVKKKSRKHSPPYFPRGLLCTRVKTQGVWKNRDFRPIFRFISQTIQDMAIVTR